MYLGERYDRQHPQHVQRHEHRPGQTEPDPGQDQRQGRLRHHQGQDGQREGCCSYEVGCEYVVHHIIDQRGEEFPPPPYKKVFEYLHFLFSVYLFHMC